MVKQARNTVFDYRKNPLFGWAIKYMIFKITTQYIVAENVPVLSIIYHYLNAHNLYFICVIGYLLKAR